MNNEMQRDSKDKKRSNGRTRMEVSVDRTTKENRKI